MRDLPNGISLLSAIEGEDTSSLSAGVVGATQKQVETLRASISVIVAKLRDGSYGVILGHNLSELCPDHDDDESIDTGVTHSKQLAGTSHSLCLALQSEIDELNALSVSYSVNPESKKRYHEICQGILARSRK